MLKQDWTRLKLTNAPKVQSLPDIFTLAEIKRLMAAAQHLRYRIFILTGYSMGLRLSETLALRALWRKHQHPQSELKAIAAIQRCRAPQAGEIRLHCNACAHQHRQPRACGHRFCPQCQNHDTRCWLERQQAKLLSVHYFMATFTLPRRLKALA